MVAVYVALVAPTISANPLELEVVEDCHWMVPVYPLKVNVVLLLPLTTLVEPLILPATEGAFTVVVIELDVVEVEK